MSQLRKAGFADGTRKLASLPANSSAPDKVLLTSRKAVYPSNHESVEISQRHIEPAVKFIVLDQASVKNAAASAQPVIYPSQNRCKFFICYNTSRVALCIFLKNLNFVYDNMKQTATKAN